ncbi:MAG: phospholipid carrier-dependent glycosyltransferase [Chloroflexi bacterium]|jgi:dolichyl-phosphate-mannose-protein mannosyltransferase|nr:phospholipid carrier-dependent glycosyltransferase [Chloroflexota bacterium]
MLFDWLKQRENILALCIALVVLVLHLIIIDQVDRNMFDEAHYIPEAKAILEGGELGNLEHPPLGKLFIAAGIDLFGDNPWGWRTFSVLFGVASIILFYLICQNLTSNRYIPLIATFIFAFENQSFVQSSVAMLDVYGLTLLLASFWLYLRGNYISSGIVLALSVLAKLSGVIGVVAIIGHWLLVRRNEKWKGLKFVIVSPLAFILLMPALDWLAIGSLECPWDRIGFMRENLSVLTFSNTTHDQMSHPWTWIVSFKPMCFWYKPTYWASPSWTILALIIPSLCYAVYATIKRSSLSLFAILWFISTYVSLIAIDLITDRIMFKFYFYPTIGAICLVLGVGIYHLWTLSSKREDERIRWAIRIPILGFFIAHLVVFAIMSPYCDYGWTTNCG